MQIQEQTAMVAKDYMKGKGCKRPRSNSPLALTMATSSCSTANMGGGISTGSSVESDISGTSDQHMMLTSCHHEFKQRIEEEEDMANCLILLAKGRHQAPSPRFPTAKNEAAVAADEECYRCKTCNKSFSSFRALGGHRASHKKPYIKEKRVDQTIRSGSLAFGGGGTLIMSRAHECSICGAEFASGQALGGHMRRHRPLPPSENSSHREGCEEKKPAKLLLLDLNLPAPEELVFSATSLINYNY